MNIVDIRSVFAIAAAALVTACGGSGATGPAGPDATRAAPMVQVNAPVADCEAEGCNRPRIVDGLAEQYRAGAVEALPAAPLQAGAPAAAPNEAAPGAAAAPQ